MNSSERARRTDAWLRVYHHEISRRRKIAQEKPRAYRQLFGQNHKGLFEPHTCPGVEAWGKHIWVPATHLWIHDKVKGFKIGGVNRRGFSEAQSYEYDDFRIVPQICWSCVMTRELMTPVMTWSERQKSLADHIREGMQHKPKGKKGKPTMIEDYEELLDNIEYA